MSLEPTLPAPCHPQPGSLGEDFRTTRWTEVGRAKTDSPEGRRALTELCNAYYEPVTTFLRCELRDADAARELAHDFLRACWPVAPSPGRSRGADDSVPICSAR